jgi:hypothetical protein
MRMRRVPSSIVGALVLASVALGGANPVARSRDGQSPGQTPQPFPRPPAQPTQPQPTAGAQTSPPPAAPEPPPVRSVPAPTPAPVPQPTEASLGVRLYPNAQYIGSYDAGKGQRFYLYGVAASFADMVTFYRTTLKTRGEALFETPGTHLFEIARYRDESMAFPPSVTVKDYTWGGSPGLPNPKAGGQPTHFPTVLQIVPVPAAR